MLEQRLFVNARFHTLWAPQPQVTAVLTRGERIVAMGTREELAAHSSGVTETVDLDGATVIPGLTDAHIHTANFAREIAALDLRGTRDLAETLERVRVYSDSRPATGWVFGGRWDFNIWTVPVQPNRYDLDAVTGGRPAALPSIDGHTVWANSAALAAVGFDASTPDPVGGEIVRDEHSEPTGILREAACDRLEEIMHSAEAGDLGTQLLEAQRRLLAVGLTGVHDFDGEDALAAYRGLRDAGRLGIRVHKAIPMTALELAIDEGRATGDGDAWLRTGPVKLFSDGALGSHSCHMSEAFPGEDGNTGIEVIPYGDLRELVRRAAGSGIGVATHAIGDRANELVLDAYADLAMNPLDAPTGIARPASRLRHRIEHAQHLRPSDIARMAQLGVIPSMQPTHCTTDIPLASTLLAGRDLASYAWRSLLDAGAIPAFGSDAPVEHPNPMYGIHAAVTRQNGSHEPDGGWQPGECVTVGEAIEGFTAGAAYASGEESHKGRLRPGMLADFTALADDPFTAATSELRDMPVQSTTVGGVVRFRRNH
ncbi:amidohydrolase [Arthrobacter sp. ERGS1:01]|uniref:amidohydrolase n=1 Tax=Arthrobacter sp. ERGS1:01 TaxID=1704044 RepID=UPI0006B4E714|nr:amidohydrolase [Arthrobacter sp. ERGS1:01]ALE05273.1 amidohydrolase [Arthrobacter sp. ERGS1:01]